MPLIFAASLVLLTVAVVLATLRLTRLITSDWLGEWLIVRPVRRWAKPHEDASIRVARHMLDVWALESDDREVSEFENELRGDLAAGNPLSWQGRLAKGLDCPFCIGFWIGALMIGATTGVVVVDAQWLNWAWGSLLGSLALNYLTGHISSRLD